MNMTVDVKGRSGWGKTLAKTCWKSASKSAFEQTDLFTSANVLPGKTTQSKIAQVVTDSIIVE